MNEPSVKQSKKLIWCDQCKTNPCVKGYAPGKPDYCQALDQPELLKEIPAQYSAPEAARIQTATVQLLDRQKKEDTHWPRIKEAIEFAKELGVKKVGLAVCTSMHWQGAEVAKLMKLAGLEPCMVSCMTGGMGKAETGIPEDKNAPPCNPVLQAELLNQAGTEFNFIYGLCMGHDTLFMMHSKAPVSVILVKDRAMANNPGAVLFSFYHRNKLYAEYGGEPDNTRM